MTREEYRYAFANYAFDEVETFYTEEEAVEYFNKINANNFYCNAEIIEGKTWVVDFKEMTRWTEPAWKVCYNKVSLMKRLAMAVNA